MTTENTTLITESQRKLADVIKANLSIEKDTGVPTPSKDTWKQILAATDVTETEYLKVNTFLKDLVPAGKLALAEVSLPVFEANKDLESVSTKIKLAGGDSLKLGIERRVEFPVPGKPDEPKIVRYGETMAKLQLSAMKNQALSNTHAHINELFAAALNK
jgi:hypothetical protein